MFPELFIPGYPYGMTLGFTVGSRNREGRKDWLKYYENSILVPGTETDRLCMIAKEKGIYLSMGISERDSTNGTLYNSNIMIDANGNLQNHRKLKPTGSERVVWGDGNKDFFPVMDTPWGPLGNLICWESYMPLARVALYQKGITLSISPNTNDNEEWQNTIKHIAIEGKCYFINCDMYFTKEMYPKDLHCLDEINKLNDIVYRGGSCVVKPFGHIVSEQIWDKEAIIYVTLEMDKVVSSRMEHDPCGHYSREDVLELKVEYDK